MSAGSEFAFATACVERTCAVELPEFVSAEPFAAHFEASLSAVAAEDCLT